MVNERQDVTGSNCLKDAAGKVFVDKNGTKYTRKEYVENMMNEEHEWGHEISFGAKEGLAECITILEVIAALKKMKKHKSEFMRASSKNNTSHRNIRISS